VIVDESSEAIAVAAERLASGRESADDDGEAPRAAG
jgi:hypothetical protein